MDKVVIDLYKKKLYTDETFKKFVRVGWITPNNLKKLQVKITNHKLNSLWFLF